MLIKQLSETRQSILAPDTYITMSCNLSACQGVIAPKAWDRATVGCLQAQKALGNRVCASWGRRPEGSSTWACSGYPPQNPPHPSTTTHNFTSLW